MNYYAFFSIVLFLQNHFFYAMEHDKNELRISTEQLHELIHKQVFVMDFKTCQHADKTSGITFIYHNGDTSFIAYCSDAILETVPKAVRNHFNKEECNNGALNIFCYRRHFTTMQNILSSHPPLQQTSEIHTYITLSPLRIPPSEQADVPLSNVKDLAWLKEEPHVLIYTGAGISAGKVPQMNQLLQQMKYNSTNCDTIADVVTETVKNPYETIRPLDDFFKCCITSEPSNAHYAITDLATLYTWPVITENLDLLHQKAGLKAITRLNYRLLDQISPITLKNTQYILCIGISNDESSLLAQFKELNPAGKIIAINLHIPEYVSTADVVLLGDAQEIVPQLKRCFTQPI